MKEALCRAFCEALTVRKVRTGIAVGTPFRRGQDALTFFVMRVRDDPQERVRLEDDGFTIPDLEMSGADLSAGTRARVFAELLTEHRVHYDEEDGVLHSEPMTEAQVAQAALSFVAFLLRMQDFRLLTEERVRETFRDDVLKAVTERFAGRASVFTNEAPVPALRDYRADILIRAAELAPLAVFIGTAETRALEAILLRQAMTLAEIAGHVMLVVQREKPPKINQRTINRAYQTVAVKVFPGYVRQTMDEMEAKLFGAISAPQSTVRLQ